MTLRIVLVLVQLGSHFTKAVASHKMRPAKKLPVRDGDVVNLSRVTEASLERLSNGYDGKLKRLDEKRGGMDEMKR